MKMGQTKKTEIGIQEREELIQELKELMNTSNYSYIDYAATSIKVERNKIIVTNRWDANQIYINQRVVDILEKLGIEEIEEQGDLAVFVGSDINPKQTLKFSARRLYLGGLSISFGRSKIYPLEYRMKNCEFDTGEWGFITYELANDSCGFENCKFIER